MLAQKVALSYGSRILIQFFQVAVTILVARVAGPSVLGILAYGLAFCSMFRMIAELGIGTSHMKLISEGRDAKGCIGTYVWIKTVLIGIYFVVVWAVYLVQKYVFRYRFESREFEYVLIISIFIMTIEQFMMIPKVTFAAYTQQAKQDIPDLINQILYQILRVVVVLLGYRALALAFSNLVTDILGACLLFWLFRGYPIGKYDRNLAKLYFAMSLPIIIMLIAQSLVNQTEIVLLHYLTNSEQVGYYTAGLRIGGFVKLIGVSIGTLFFPMFSKAISQGKIGIINTSIKKFERFTTAFILPFVIVSSVFADTIVYVLLGKKFASTIPILAITNLTMFIYVLSIPYGNILSGKGLFKLLAKVYVLELAFFLITAFVFVSPVLLDLSGRGIATSLLLANVLLGLMFFFNAKKEIPEISLLPSQRILAYGSVFGILAYAFYSTMHANYWGKGVFFFAFFLLYWGLAYILKIIHKEDWIMVANVLSLKKMRGYIRGEVFFAIKKNGNGGTHDA